MVTLYALTHDARIKYIILKGTRMLDRLLIKRETKSREKWRMFKQREKEYCVHYGRLYAASTIHSSQKITSKSTINHFLLFPSLICYILMHFCPLNPPIKLRQFLYTPKRFFMFGNYDVD